MRVALFTLEALPNARAVRRLIVERAADIAFVGLSDAERPSAGGLVGQVRRHLARSGPGFLPYLAVNFGLPDLARLAAPLTQRLAGTRDVPEATPVRTLCRRLGIPVRTIADVNDAQTRADLARNDADLLLSFHFDQIFKAEILEAVPLGGLNVHPSLLPRHRGPLPTFHALMETPPAFGVTVHRLAVRIDAGAILAQRAVTLPPGTSATRAAMLLHEEGRACLDPILGEIAATGRVPEGETVPTRPYCPFPTRADLAALRVRRGKLVDGADLRAALRLCMKG